MDEYYANIITTEELDKNIDAYKITNSKEPNLYMNEDTAKVLTACINNIKWVDEKINNKLSIPIQENYTIGYYTGNNIYLDNSLKFGLISIKE